MTKVALVQFKADTDKHKNLDKILDYINKAAQRGAKLCAFPEFMMFFTPSS
ncbi:MAG: nitrilase-related carbon-nitrogen hydrolase, partial [Nitrosopumilaceae archaeon]